MMGQYQQWLLYLEFDQSLRAELEASEAELARLQERARLLEESKPHQENQIIRLLAKAFSAQEQQYHTPPAAAHTASPVQAETNDASDAPAPRGNNVYPSSEHAPQDQSSEIVSPALFAWGQLPNFGAQDLQPPFIYEETALPPLPRPEMDLLPEDMTTFLEQHSPTDPQIQIPRWLHNLTISSTKNQRIGPIDEESIRTNRLVQRWLERWGRLPSNQNGALEDSAHE